MGKPKTVIVLGDLHCGSKAGLTHPSYQHGNDKLAKLRKEMWNFYEQKVEELPRPHLVIANGDLIEGRGQCNGGKELLTMEMLEQAAMATEALKIWKAKNYAISYGTPYHSGKYENYENLVAKDLKATIDNQLFLEIDGVKFDIKHKVGSSGIPHGRASAINKANLWNLVWADHGQQPRCDVFIRSHVHYHVYSGDSTKLCMTLPALQAAATEFGARQCEGYVDFGLVEFTVYDDGTYSWESHIRKLVGVTEKTTKF